MASRRHEGKQYTCAFSAGDGCLHSFNFHTTPGSSHLEGGKWQAFMLRLATVWSLEGNKAVVKETGHYKA